MVDDESVIEVLNVTKSTAADVTEKLTVAADTEIKINIAREEFRPSLYHITAMFSSLFNERYVVHAPLLSSTFRLSVCLSRVYSD